MNSTLTAVPGITVGHAHDERALTGCTVVVAAQGAVCGVDVRGGAPGTRETDLLAPGRTVERVHALCLAGGSAFGLDAACGVAEYLEERSIGFRAGRWIVPIVPAAILFDLAIGDGNVRPDRAMGYRAAAVANSEAVGEGNVGAGCGATVGKLAGFERAMKSGLGTGARPSGDGLVVAALAVVNALGEVRDPTSSAVLAGARADDGSFMDSLALFAERRRATPFGNTTLAVVATNALLTKGSATELAGIAQEGLRRTIFPVHTAYDGDAIFVLGNGTAEASIETLGVLACEAVAEAVVRAVTTARAAGGLPASRDVLP